MSAESDILRPRDRARPVQVVGGYLSALAIFVSAIGVAWHPLRLIPISLLLALVASAMSGPSNKLARAAVMIGAACFFLGMTVSVVTSRPLW